MLTLRKGVFNVQHVGSASQPEPTNCKFTVDPGADPLLPIDIASGVMQFTSLKNFQIKSQVFEIR